MRSPAPVILFDESKDLPFRACAALAHRAVTRAFEILPHADPVPLPEEAAGTVRTLLDLLSRIAAGSIGESALYLHLAQKPLVARIDRILKQLPGGTPRRVA